MKKSSIQLIIVSTTHQLLDDLHDGFLGSLCLMFVPYDLNLVPVLVRLVWKLHLDIKVAANLGDVCTPLANNLGVVLWVDFQYKSEATQFLKTTKTIQEYTILIKYSSTYKT